MSWEYKVWTLADGYALAGVVKTAEVEEALNEFGRDGWELVSTLATTSNGSSRTYAFVLKRPKK